MATRRWEQARFWVASGRVPFFDFFRDRAFGFVESESGKGFFTQITYRGDELLDAECACREGRAGRYCAHALSVHLRVLDWPNPACDLSQQFDTWYLTDFFLELSSWAQRNRPDLDPKTLLDPSDSIVSPRIRAYLGFSESLGAVTERDRQIRQNAHRRARTETESELSRRGLKSKRMRFEESGWFDLAKMIFFASQNDAVRLSVSRAATDTARVAMSLGGTAAFHCEIPIGVFFRILRQHPNRWLPHTHFKIHLQALPTVYRIRFTPAGHLEIQACVRVSESEAEPIQSLEVIRQDNLYVHDSLGYFQIQIGLSPFELAFSDGSLHLIEAQSVAGFIKEHWATLQQLDRSFIDDLVFEELIVEKIDRVELDLTHFVDNRFQASWLVHAGKVVFDGASLARIAQKKKRFVKYAGRLVDTRAPDWKLILSGVAAGEPDSLNIKTLFRLIGFFASRLEARTQDETEKAFKKLIAQRAENPPSLGHTKLALRPYQIHGYQWLYFLFAFRLGGLLCDQMGLGKTHQAMALSAACLNEHPNARILVVCPASVVYHWEHLLHAFGPFPAQTHHGPQRRPEHLKRSPMITITTYPTLRSDIEYFVQVPYDLIVFDEVQTAKNAQTKIHKALKTLTGMVKIGLTGTPIENQLRDLKALMDLVLPGYLGRDDDFRHAFEIPIVTYGAVAAREKLRRTIAPFTMRRSVQEVLPELPPITETRHVYRLSSYEQEMYAKIKEDGKKATSDGAKPTGYLHIFNIIDRLKRFCDHPALFFNRQDYAAFPATKWAMFTQILQEALDAEEKVVVFTQYLGMIALFEAYLRNHDIPHACVTGKTPDRKAQLQRFQSDPSCRVFLGTIRASGLGVDLHAGRVLIHYDRWWNPAREAQATSRIHRIGQHHPVQVFHLLGRDTIEDRIDEIIEKKRDLLDGIVQFDATNAGKIFSLQELLAILD